MDKPNIGISQPVITTSTDGIIFQWEHGDEKNIVVKLSRFSEKHEKLEAEIEIVIDGGLVGREHAITIISNIRFNLLSSSGRKGIEMACIHNSFSEEIKFYPWHNIVEQVSIYTARKVREEIEPLIFLNKDYGKKRPEYLLYPFFVKNAASVIFAERGAAKSLFITLIDLALTLPWYDNPLGFNISPEDKNTVLYLDWECDANITGWTKECLLRGMGAGWCDLPYQRCSRPLADNIDFYIRRIAEAKANVVIIDSLALSVGANLNEIEPAQKYFNALRQLPVTPIIIGQTSKDIMTRRKTIYGNALYEYSPRSIWEASKKQEPGSSELILTLHNKKPPPFAAYHEPMAYRFIFNGNTTKVETTEPITERGGGDSPTEIDIALDIIYKSEEPLTAAEILSSSGNGIKASNIWVVLGRILKKEDYKVKKNSDGKYYYDK